MKKSYTLKNLKFQKNFSQKQSVKLGQPIELISSSDNSRSSPARIKLDKVSENSEFTSESDLSSVPK